MKALYVLLLVLLLGVNAYATGGVDPNAEAAGACNEPASSCQVDFSGNATAKETILVLTEWAGQSLTATVTDNVGNTYIPITAPINAPGGVTRGQVFYCINTGALNAVTVTLSGNSTTGFFDGILVDAYGLTGLDQINPLDSLTVTSTTGTGTALSVSSGTPAFPNEMMWGLFVSTAVGEPWTIGGSGWTEVTGGEAVSEMVYKNISSGAQTASLTASSSVGWIGIAVGFKTAGGCDTDWNCYIYSGAGGSGTGASWTNAYTGFGTAAGKINPASMTRGVTYWTANGAYGAQTFSTADSGVFPITIEGATAPSHGPDSTWSNSYAGQATFIGDNSITTDYWTFEGQTRNSNWQGGYTLKFWNQSDSAGAAMLLSGVNYETFDYVEMEGTGDAFPNNTSTSDRCNPSGGTGTCPADGGTWQDNGVEELVPDTHLYFGHGWYHNTGNVTFQMNDTGSGGSANNYGTWEYNYISYNHTGMNAGHDEAYSLYGSNVIIRFNVFQDIAGTGQITTAGAGQPTLSNWDVYGNLFFWDSTYVAWNGDYYLAINDDGIIDFLGEAMSGYVHFYNNTMYGIYNSAMDVEGAGAGTFAIGVQSGSGGSICGSTCPTVVVENNLWVGMGYANGTNYCSVVTGATCTYNYNAAWEDSVPSGSNWQTDGNSQDYNVSGSTTPFVSPTASTIAGFELTTPDPFAAHAGISLASPYNSDMLGITRSSNGTWDRGALQIAATSSVCSAVGITMRGGSWQ